MHPKNRFCSGMKMGNKSYFTYKRAEQEETLKKVEENYKLLWNMWKKYGSMREKRKVVFKMLLNVNKSSKVTKKTKEQEEKENEIYTKTKRGKTPDGGTCTLL